MTDDTKNIEKNDTSSSDLSRRDFVALSLAAGLAAATGSASQQVAGHRDQCGRGHPRWHL